MKTKQKIVKKREITTEQKKQIAKEIEYLISLTSAEKVAVRAGASSATISQMINENWELIADKMWRKVKLELDIQFNIEWKTAQTTNLEYIYRHAEAAKEKSISFGISHDAGTGKSEAYKLIAVTLSNVIYIECKTFWRSKSYAKALVKACGLKDTGTTEDLLERFIDHLRKLKKPLVIIDQMDKLKDSSMDFFIDMYNDLSGNCGFLISGVPALEKRIKRGVNADRSGYFEIWSRIGRKFLKLNDLVLSDVEAICVKNGLTDMERIETIFFNCEGDLRRVKQDVESYFLNQQEVA